MFSHLSSPDLLFYSILLLAGSLSLIIVTKLFGPLIGKRTRGQDPVGGIQFQDVERMHDKGLISEEECRKLRKTVACLEADRLKMAGMTEVEADIISRGVIDPEALRELIPPEEQEGDNAVAGRMKSSSLVDTRPASAMSMQGDDELLVAGKSCSIQDGPSLPVSGHIDDSVLVDPLGGISEDAGPVLERLCPSDIQPARPSMNMPRVIQEKNRWRQEESGQSVTERSQSGEDDLDIEAMYKRGAITDDEYMKLKRYFKDS